MKNDERLRAVSGVDRSALNAIARAAVVSLHAELVLSPKPGLVCPGDPGSHSDMNATTMLRSLFALRHGYRRLAVAGASGASFRTLQSIGVAAEAAMRRATCHVNTHRGAIFQLGLLVAATAACTSEGQPPTPGNLRNMLQRRWSRVLRARAVLESSHGLAMAMRHGAGGARQEAADAFPTVFEIVLPALHAARAKGHGEQAARLHALMTSVACTVDTNLLYRGGTHGLRYARHAASDFLSSGGVDRLDYIDALSDLGRCFVTRRLSPGGSADILAAVLFVDRVTRRP